MLLLSLILVSLFGTLIIFIFYTDMDYKINENILKISVLIVTVLDLFISLIIWFLFNNNCRYFQYVQKHYITGHYDFCLGLDGLSIYFVLLTTLIAPISIISNWKYINNKTAYFLVIILLLESALLYTVLDILMFYIFFGSILAPLFILIGFFGSYIYIDPITCKLYYTINSVGTGLICLFISGCCIVLYELFNKTFLLKKGGFISRVYHYTLCDGNTEKSLIVFGIVFYIIFRLAVPIENYYVFMNSSGSGPNDLGSNNIGANLNSWPPRNSIGSDLGSFLNNDGIKGRLCYFTHFGKDYIRIKVDDGEMLHRLQRRELPICAIDSLRLTSSLDTTKALNLEKCQGKIWHTINSREGWLLPIEIKKSDPLCNFRGNSLKKINGMIFVERLTV